MIEKGGNENMNKVILIGRITKPVDVRQSQSGNKVARYTLAVDRRFKREGDPDADFISCVAFSKSADFAENWLHKGMKIAVQGRIQTGSYTNKDGFKVYTTDIIVEDQEFCESKAANDEARGEALAPKPPEESSDGFMNIPDDLDDGCDDLPFK